MKTYSCLNCGTSNSWTHQKLNKYCSQHCQHDYQYKKRIGQWINEGIDWTGKVPNWVKRYLNEKDGNGCKICGLVEHNHKPLVLECDHIDGNHTNNALSNLRMICPNCHSQTETYKNKNKGNGRQSRRKVL
jgi:hypothetical protein